MNTIVSGFTVPLKNEHVDFFKTILIPLYKVQTFPVFCGELYKCSMIYLQKDNNLALCLLEGILKYWPHANVAKEHYFLPLLAEILEYCKMDLLKPLIEKVFKKMVKCLESGNS